MIKSKKKASVRAVCKVCGIKMYSKTLNKDGRVICPACQFKQDKKNEG